MHISDYQDKMVKVTMAKFGGEDYVFEGKVADYNDDAKVLWVERSEDGDWLQVNISNPNINKVELIEEKEIEISTHQEMKEIRKAIEKALKWEDEDVTVFVKVYDCTENDGQTYDVEINYGIGDEHYTDGYTNQTFYGRYEGDKEAEKMAVKRAKAVLKTVKGWFANNDQITVQEGVEVYHV